MVSVSGVICMPGGLPPAGEPDSREPGSLWLGPKTLSPEMVSASPSHQPPPAHVYPQAWKHAWPAGKTRASQGLVSDVIRKCPFYLGPFTVLGRKVERKQAHFHQAPLQLQPGPPRALPLRVSPLFSTQIPTAQTQPACLQEALCPL